MFALLPVRPPLSTRQSHHEQSGEPKRLRALVSLGHLQREGGQGALSPQLTRKALGGCITSILHCRLKSGSVGANSSGCKMHSHERRLIGGDDELCGLGSHGEWIGRLGPAWLDAEVHSGLHLPIRPATLSASALRLAALSSARARAAERAKATPEGHDPLSVITTTSNRGKTSRIW